MKKTLRLLFLILVFLPLFTCQKESCLTKNQKEYLSQNPNLVIALFIYYPPYQFVNDDGHVDGILVDYLRTLEEKIEYKFKKKVFTNWQTLMSEAEQGNIDLILEIQNTPERQNYLTFTKPIFFNDHVIVSKKGSGFKNLNDLKGKKIAVGDEHSIEEYLRNKYPELVLVPLVDEKASLKALSSGNVDGFIGLKSVVNYTIKKENLTNIEINSSINFKYKLSMGINKKRPTLAKIIKKGSNAISINEKNEILDKWLFNIVKPIHKKPIFWKILLSALLSILLALFLFNRYLKSIVKKKTRELRVAKLKAEKRSNLKTLFLQNISHEVRTPLNSIIGFSNLLKEGKVTKTDYIETITQESNKLTNILNNIIEISELTTDKKKPILHAFSLHKALNIISEIYDSKAKHKGLNFQFNNNLTLDEDYIMSNKSRVVKAISNVLDNAVKFTNTGHITFTVSVKNNTIHIIITDTGIGIKPELSKIVFREFYQEEKELSKKYDGLGIGLSIANENIKSLGGNISLVSTEKKGATFIITLPFKPTIIPEREIIKPINSTLKILIAEDMRLNYLVLEKTLDQIIPDNKEIIWTKNGKEAVEKVKKSRFDIVLMDIKMPILDGYEATKQIKQIKPTLPVIAQTAYAHEEDYNKAITIGFDGYLTKPISLKALKRALQDFFVIP